MPAVSRVLVAGGGIGGLALATALRRNDIERITDYTATLYIPAANGQGKPGTYPLVGTVTTG